MLKTTLKNLSRNWFGFASSFRSNGLDRLNADLTTDDELNVVQTHIDKWLNAKGGEVSARAMAAEIGQFYLELSMKGKHRFFVLLASAFGNDRECIQNLCRDYLETADEREHREIEDKLRKALISPRIRLLRQFTALPQGIKFLVDLRADLLQLTREDKSLKSLDQELHHLLLTWFDVGLLDMDQITWNSPAVLLDKLIEYEAVHHIDSWQDLRHRLVQDRRCYAFFHPNMPGEPLIFVWVALVNGIARNVQNLLDDSAPNIDPAEADTAIFYSISNAQKGLRGISFGNFLIKRVVEKLRTELPNITTFSTLSPIPGFSRWVTTLSAEDIAAIWGEEGQEALVSAAALLEHEPEIKTYIEDQSWLENQEVVELLKPQFEVLLFHYFHQRRGDNQPIDPVERFHLGNGAHIEQINWQGDTSENGQAQSLGFMVNYLYSLKDIDANHEAYASERKIIVSSRLKGLKKEVVARGERVSS